jgi:hypothetical protein
MDAQTLMLLMVQLLAMVLGCLFLLWIIFLQHRNRVTAERPASGENNSSTDRPATWVAVRTVGAAAARAVLKNKQLFFINPRGKGWVIVTGSGLPNPSEDVDACHLFLTALSRELGHVQYFHMEKMSAHHAWARMDDGYVTRAYAWAGETIWDQGVKTLAERELGLNCPGYGEEGETESWVRREKAAANVEKIPLLAARWSLDPGIMCRAEGIAGESSQFN